MQLEEKYQKILKECQKRPENRGCSDCTGRGNQYVVLDFNTFVCTTCSGIHREMQHKIKSVGMSTFTTEEIKAIDKGGNALAKAQWMARYSANDQPIPSEGEADKIRAHLKLKYQQKRWYSHNTAARRWVTVPRHWVSVTTPGASPARRSSSLQVLVWLVVQW